MNPVVVHVVRPYASEQEYLNAEAWSIDAKSMLLVDAEALPPDTAVLFDVALSDGQKPIRAEGRVVGSVAAKGERPGGVRVRFKRFGAATKAFIERAVKAKSASGELERPSQLEPSAPSQVEVERISATDLERVSATDVERISVTDFERVSATDFEHVSVPAVRPSMTALEQAPEPAASQREPSGVRPRVAGPVTAPANRDELLERLRRRRQAG